jgi:hypothetical protein
MASAAEYTFIQATAKAEGVRQAAKAAALATFSAAGFAGSALATYTSALASADSAYLSAVQSAGVTLGETIGTLGTFQPVNGNIANLLNGY